MTFHWLTQDQSCPVIGQNLQVASALVTFQIAYSANLKVGMAHSLQSQTFFSIELSAARGARCWAIVIIWDLSLVLRPDVIRLNNKNIPRGVSHPIQQMKWIASPGPDLIVQGSGDRGWQWFMSLFPAHFKNHQQIAKCPIHYLEGEWTLKLWITVCSNQSGPRNVAAVTLFWHFCVLGRSEVPNQAHNSPISQSTLIGSPCHCNLTVLFPFFSVSSQE